METIIKGVLDKYVGSQINLDAEAARELLAKEISEALALRENIELAKDERQREHDASFGKVPTAAVRLLAGGKPLEKDPFK